MKSKVFKNLILEAYAEVLTELNEAPGGMFYITTSLRDARKALAHLDDMHRGKFEVNDPNTFYFTDESEAHDALEHFGAEDIEVIDTNIEEALNESLLDQLSEDDEEEEEPQQDPDAQAAPLKDSTDQILQKFPTLQAAIIKLQTEDFKQFVSEIDWISPRPTSFRINLKNGQNYILKWTGTGFEAQIMGKRYYINKIDDYQQALDKLSVLYKEAPMKGAGEDMDGEFSDSADTGGGGDFPGDDAAGGGADDLGGHDLGGDDTGGDEGGEDLTDEPIDFEDGEEG